MPLTIGHELASLRLPRERVGSMAAGTSSLLPWSAHGRQHHPSGCWPSPRLISLQTTFLSPLWCWGGPLRHSWPQLPLERGPPLSARIPQWHYSSCPVLGQGPFSLGTCRDLPFWREETGWHYTGPLGEWKAACLGCDLCRHLCSFLHLRCSQWGGCCGSAGWGEESGKIPAPGYLPLLCPNVGGNIWCLWPSDTCLCEEPRPPHHLSHWWGEIFFLPHPEDVCSNPEGECGISSRYYWTVSSSTWWSVISLIYYYFLL